MLTPNTKKTNVVHCNNSKGLSIVFLVSLAVMVNLKFAVMTPVAHFHAMRKSHVLSICVALLCATSGHVLPSVWFLFMILIKLLVFLSLQPLDKSIRLTSESVHLTIYQQLAVWPKYVKSGSFDIPMMYYI